MWRLSGGLGILALLAAGLAGAGAAHADDPAVTLSASPAELKLYPQYPGNPDSADVKVNADNPGADIVGDVTFTYDFTGLDGVAIAEIDSGGGSSQCRSAAGIATCVHDGLRSGKDLADSIHVTSIPGAEEGATGTVRVIARADGVTFNELTVEVTLDARADLGVSPLEYIGEPRRTQPGDTIEKNLGFANWGNTTADGLLLEVDATGGLDFTTRYSNCEYGTASQPVRAGEKEKVTVSKAICAFDLTFEPRTYYTVAEKLRFGVSERAMWDRLHVHVAENTDAAREEARGGGDFVRGLGPELTLTKLPDTSETQEQADTWTGTDAEAQFTAVNTADLVAHAGEATGRVGDTVTATVGFTNRGPAWIGHHGYAAGATRFTVPEGARVVRKPASCTGLDSSGRKAEPQLGAPVYTCVSSPYVNVGEKVSFGFGLKIDKVVKDASGPVVVTTGSAVDGAESFDRKQTNNTAEFVLTGKPGTGSGGSTTTGGNSPSGQGDRGNLADTGAGGLGTLGGLSLLAIGLGGVAWVAARWRRARS
ncbi:hypothetical protein SRB5_43630 [Streptomyces sp. RB5]|uniref:Peptidase n=1 Tax=Streptomyces smaragdinus TaxID=2585196 RepID=A0A7K0CLB0_9ACTN|nr:hypothetical protein [Streptomyces smaragdinus]MQY14201.1 hypothetical protein [Streptomyces smaragdinus]